MSRVVPRFWPLLASLGFHAALATALMTRGAVASSPTTSHLVARDIWIGDTLEAAEPAVPTPSPASTPAPSPPRVHATVDEATPRAKPVTAARHVAARTPDSARAGGMSGNETDAPARGFAKAFTRALPAANTGDPVWGTLPLGPIGFVRVTVTVGADGSIGESRVLDKPQKPPAHLERVVDRTLILLRGGRFALTNGGAGTETLRLDVTLSERPMESGPLALGFEAPLPGAPGRAYFQLASGRFVEARVAIERN